jgi:hypothetical protein
MDENMNEHIFLQTLTADSCQKLVDNTYILDSTARNLVFQRFQKYYYSTWKREYEISQLKYDILSKCKKL